MIRCRRYFLVPWSLIFEPLARPPVILEAEVLILMVRVGRREEDGQVKEEGSFWVHLSLLLEIPEIA